MPRLIATAALLVSALVTSPALASIEFHLEALGYGEDGNDEVGATVDVSIDNTNKIMTIVLRNTIATQKHGDVLTGFILDFKPDITGVDFYPDEASNPSLYDPSNNEIWEFRKDGNKKYWKVVDDNTNLGGSWKLLTAGDAGKALGDFGVATNGGNGLFSAGGSLGNVDYGVVGPGTFIADGNGEDHTPPDGLKNDNQSPLVQSIVQFQFSFTGTIADDQIMGGVAMFGTNGHYINFNPPGGPGDDGNPVPEPATIAIWSMIGFGAIGGAAWRRRRRKAA